MKKVTLNFLTASLLKKWYRVLLYVFFPLLWHGHSCQFSESAWNSVEEEVQYQKGTFLISRRVLCAE